MTPTALALLALSLVLAAFLPACYRATAALERLSAPPLPDGSPTPVSPLLRVTAEPTKAPTAPRVAMDENEQKRQAEMFYRERGLVPPTDLPPGVGVEMYGRPTVPQVR